MRHKFNLLAAGVIAMITLLTACTKEPPNYFYKTGNAPSLSITSNTLLEPSPADSNKYLLQLLWTQPNLQTDFSNTKFISEVDVESGDFSKPISRTTFATFVDSFQAKVINSYLLEKGYAFNQVVKMKTRVVASYSNNNDRQISNIQTFDFKVYKVPPQVTLPVSNRLFITGDATMAWWNLPLVNNGIDYSVAQEFVRFDETTYGGKIFLYGGKQYLIVPYNSATPPTSGWDNKYAVQNTSEPGLSAGGRFGHRPSNAAFDANFPAPAADGYYNMKFDFQTGFFTVTDQRDKPVPDSLYAIGDATQGGWDNANGNTTLKGQWMRRLNSSIFEKDLNLTGGRSLKFITKITQWQPQFGKGSADGQLGYNYGGGSDPNVISIPPASGMYRVRVDFYNMTYTLTKL